MADLDINLRLRDREFNRGIQNAERGINRANAAISSFIGNLASQVFVQFAQTISQTFRGAIQAAQRQEAAIQRLNSALRNAGVTSRQASRQIQEFAAQLQNVTRFGDEATIEMTALAISMGATTQQATRVVAVAADLAEAFGISFESAVRNVAKTLSGMRGELGELVPALRSVTMAQLQNGDAIAILERLYGGTARDALNTFRGASEQTSNAIGDVSEALGRIITQNPAVISSLQDLTQFASNLVTVIDRNRVAIVTYGQALLVATPLIISVGTAFTSVIPAIRAFTLALATNPLIAAITIIASLAGTIFLLRRANEEQTRSLADQITTAEMFISTNNDLLSVQQRLLQITREDLVEARNTLGLAIRNNDLDSEAVVLATQRVRLLRLRLGAQEGVNTALASDIRLAQMNLDNLRAQQTLDTDLIRLRRMLRTATSTQQEEEFLNTFKNQAAVAVLRMERKQAAAEREAQGQRALADGVLQLAMSEAEITNFAANRERERQLVETGFMGRLMLIRTFIGTEQALEFAAEQRKINIMAMGVARDRSQNALRLRINKSYLDARSKQEQAAVDDQIKIRQGYVTALGNLVAAGLAFEDAGVRERKGFAIVQATINAYAGASRALVDYPFPASVAVAASVVAAGLAQVHNITNSGDFQNGGVIGGNSFSGDRLTANVNSGEMIINRSQQQNLFNAINNGNFSANAGLEYKLEELLTINQAPFIIQNADGRVMAEIVREGVRDNVDLFV